MITVIDKGGFLYEINVSGTADNSPSLIRGGVFYFVKSIYKIQTLCVRNNLPE
jgi:hypothetical protein